MIVKAVESVENRRCRLGYGEMVGAGVAVNLWTGRGKPGV
jgi:hypothetical protein